MQFQIWLDFLGISTLLGLFQLLSICYVQFLLIIFIGLVYCGQHLIINIDGTFLPSLVLDNAYNRNLITQSVNYNSSLHNRVGG